MTRRTLALAISILIAPCFALAAVSTRIESPPVSEPVKEIRPGILAGYLPRTAYPNSVKLSPPPPAEVTAARAKGLKPDRDSEAEARLAR